MLLKQHKDDAHPQGSPDEETLLRPKIKSSSMLTVRTEMDAERGSGQKLASSRIRPMTCKDSSNRHYLPIGIATIDLRERAQPLSPATATSLRAKQFTMFLKRRGSGYLVSRSHLAIQKSEPELECPEHFKAVLGQLTRKASDTSTTIHTYTKPYCPSVVKQRRRPTTRDIRTSKIESSLYQLNSKNREPCPMAVNQFAHRNTAEVGVIKWANPRQ